MTGVPTSPQTVGQVLDTGFKLFRASFKGTIALAVFAAISMTWPYAVLAFVPEVMQVLLTGEAGTGFWVGAGIVYLLSILLYSVGFGAIIHYCDRVARANTPSTGGSLKVGFTKSLVLLVAVVLYMVAVTLGMILLIIPGLFLMVSLFFYINRIVVENEGPLRALRSSNRLVWGNWWRTTLVFTVMAIIFIVINFAFTLPFSLLDGLLTMTVEEAIAGGPFSILGQVVASSIAMPYMAATMVSHYHDLQLRSEGGDLASRVDELAPTS